MFRILPCVLILLSASTLLAELDIYPIPKSVRQYTGLTATLDGQPAVVMQAQRHVGFARFGFEKSVEVVVTSTRPLVDVQVRPLAYGIKPEPIGENQWKFELPADHRRSKVAFLGKWEKGRVWRKLVFVGLPPRTEPPTDAVIIGPGHHRPESGLYEMEAGKTYYLDPGAVMEACMTAKDADGITLMGGGVIKGTRVKAPYYGGRKNAHTLWFENCNDVTVQGITVTGLGWHSTVFRGRDQLKNLKIEHLTTIRDGQQSDGIGMGGYKHVRIRNCYLMSGDNVIVFGWNHRIEDMLVENTVFEPVEAGDGAFFPQGGPKGGKGGTIGDVTFRNAFVTEMLPAVVDIRWGKLHGIENLTFENLHVDPPLGTARGGGENNSLIESGAKVPIKVTFRDTALPFAKGGHIRGKATIRLERVTADGKFVESAADLGWDKLGDEKTLIIANEEEK